MIDVTRCKPAKIRRQGEGISGPMAEMRTWLQHHGMKAHLLELSFLPAKEVRFRLQFRDPREAAAFARVFNGDVLHGLEPIAA